MQSISKDLKTQESLYKSKEKELTTYLQNSSPSQGKTAELPQQFLPTDQAPSTTHIENIKVIDIDDDLQATWDSYVSKHPQASIYHRYQWRSIINHVFNHKCFYLAAIDNHNHIVGILPLVWLKSTLFGSFSVSVPFFNYGGPLSDSGEVTEHLLAKAEEIAITKNWLHIEIRTTTPHTTPGYNLPYQSKKVSMVRELPTTDQALDKALGTKIRAQTKLATNHNPRIQFGKLELLNDFYKVFSENMRDLGTPVYSKSFFHEIIQDFPNEATLVTVYVDKTCVATAFLLGHKELVEIPWASTLRHVNKLNINMWMYREILKFSITKGFKFFDFGRSTVNAGTYKFKKQWGAKPVKHYWYYWLAANETLPEINPDNPKYRLVIAIWKKLPLWFTKFIGPKIVKNLP